MSSENANDQTDQHESFLDNSLPVYRRMLLKSIGFGAAGAAALDSDVGVVGEAAAATYQGPPRYGGTDMPIYGDTWTSTLIGAGGKMNGVTTCPSDDEVVYLWTDVGGAWRSDDNGQTWYAIRNGLGVRTLVVDPRDADKVVQAENDGLYRTEDGGDTWSYVVETTFKANGAARDSAGDVIVRKPDNPDVLLAAPLKDNLLRSTDGGQTWNKLKTTPDNIFPTDIWYHPNRPNHVFLCYNDDHETERTGVAHSTDGGVTWSIVMSGGEHPTGLTLDPGNNDIIYGSEWRTNNVYRSTDGGKNWSSHDAGIPGDAQLYDIWYDSSAIYVGGGEAIYRLPAGGSTWTTYSESTTANYDVSNWFFGPPDMIGGVAIDQNDPDVWYMAGTYAHFKSTDHGTSWTYSSLGIEEMVGMDIATDPRNDTLHCAVADTKYFRLKNHGTEIDIHREPSYHAFRNVVVAPSNPDYVAATSWLYSGNYEYPASGSVHLSTDAGNSWTKINGDGLPIEDSIASWTGKQLEEFATGISFHPNDENHIVVGISNYGCYRTTDGGDSWTELGNIPTFFTPFVDQPWVSGNMLAMSGDGSIVAGTSLSAPDAPKKTVARWDPNDGAWTFLDIDSRQYSYPKHIVADPNNDGHFYIAQSTTGVYKSTDSGATWSKIYDGRVQYVALDPNDSNRVAIARTSRLESEAHGPLLSTDGGSTWQNLAGDHLLAAKDEQTLAFSGDNLVVSSGGVSYLWIPLSKAGADTTPPNPVPASLDVTAVSDESIGIDFTPSVDWGSGVSHYNVYMNGTKQMEAGGSSVLVANLAGNTTFDVTVSAVDGAGNESDQSQAVTATTDDPTRLIGRLGWSASASATNVTDGSAANTIDGDRGTQWQTSGVQGDTLAVDMGRSHTIDKIKLITGSKWGDPPQNYAVEVSSDGSNWQRIATGYGDSGNDEWITVKSFPSTTARHVRIVLTDDEGKYDSWEVREFQVFASLSTGGDSFDPTAPTDLRSPVSTDTSIDLTWNAASDQGGSGLDHYNVYVQGFKKKEVGAGTTTTTVSIPNPGVYDIYVTAVDTVGNQSSTSNIITVNTDSTPPTTPSNLTSPFKTVSSVDLDWDGVYRRRHWHGLLQHLSRRFERSSD
jgi:photosystem II stability/assembly factor-like uncharacterized protein/chitodextrinase